ncbi:hypothetical protein [Halorussus sp. AFM4]|uniref:hypothetical protein n=1 Tax=Halorussus sp. AFM4 TaxID=3421651 RepID=UPI003EBCA9E5
MARDETARDSESETPLPGPRSRRGRAGPRATTVAGAEAVGDDTDAVPADGPSERPGGRGAPEVADGH